MFFITETKFYSKKAISLYRKIGPILKDKKNNKIKVLIVRLKYSLNENFLKKFKNLEYIISNTTGLDHIKTDYCKKKGIKIISLNDIKKKIENVQSTSDLTFGIILNLLRNISYSNNYIINNGKFDRYNFITNDLKGLKLGIIGLGRIGTRLSVYAKKFGMNVSAYDKYKSQNYFKKKNVRKASKKEILKKSNIISLNASSLSKKQILNKNDLKLVKKGCYIVNTSRAQLIDEDYIYKLVKNNHLKGYGADVHENERDESKMKKNKLLKLSKNFNVIFTPHLGGCTYESLNKTENEIAEHFCKKYAKKL